MIKSHDAEEKTEESKDSLESTQKEEERRISPTPPQARKSPEPSCAICLEQLQNKSFTDSCFHMFCFTCLVEWSKVKPECPLCKKSFNSIVHNVRSFKEFDQYYVSKSRTGDLRNCWRRFHYRTTLTPERLHENRFECSDGRMEGLLSHRMRYAPHSVHGVRMYPASQTVRRIPSVFRRRVYDEDLWVKPLNSSRIRCISPEFFRQNVACTHRLLPWLNRELLVVMPNNESQISFVIELIMALIEKYDIRSQEFHTLIEPYTASHTSHFIHEFYNFAVSPFDNLENYDRYALYDIPFFHPYEPVSSPDSDVIPLPMDYSTSLEPASSVTSRRKKQSHPKRKHSKECKKLKKIILKRNSENNCWESITRTVPFVNSSYISSSIPFELAGPSTSRGIPFLSPSAETSNLELALLNEIQYLGTNEDEECQVVEVLKPRNERTPEIVDISSGDDQPSAVAEVRIEDANDNAVSTSMMESNKELLFVIEAKDKIHFKSNDQPLTVSDDDCEMVFFKETQICQTSNTDILDKPIDYSLKPTEKKVEVDSESKIVEPCTSSNNDKIESEIPLLRKINDDSELEVSNLQRNSVIQSTVRTLGNEDTCSSSWSPLVRPKKRRALILDDASTESCSDSAQVSEVDTRVKKLKLRSVVAHYSYDHSEHESGHHSSLHKKHKERKKKKKKHKHKRRIYSSDSDC